MYKIITPVTEKYTPKKKKNLVLSEFIKKFISGSSLELIENCSTFLMFAGDKTLEHTKQMKGNSCKNRFCPVCAWRKARKDALKLSILMQYLKAEQDKEFIFLTLTTPNVEAKDLEAEIKYLNKSFKKLIERKEIKSVIKGYVRKLEVTYDRERFITKEMYRNRKTYYDGQGLGPFDNNPNYDTYNPHFHVLLAVNKSYFTDTKNYIKQSRWLDLWQQATDNPNITQVHVQKVKERKQKEVSEIAKYSAKDSDYLINENVFDTFYKALKGKRLLVYSGVFKDAATLFDNGELDKYKEEDTIEYIYALMYNWGMGKYFEQEKRELTSEEYKELNNQLIDDMEVE
ncbi:protein rep [Alkalibacillus almallahensis]|uniref:protein rep n=1 Tax=Alkalibacillus almallahensis TaxID=1379154 RepID=UPI001422D4FD|nr:protein rep [Alkalibacillus almallahensis]NIK13481.1 plasmid rolling circle replication initiator protein Rep [Alkalibacillus almallahensis]